MQVTQIGTHIPQGLGLDKVKHQNEAVEETQEPQEEVQTSETLSDEADSVEQETGDDNVRGVIRLLQEGHFKVVPELRLRINFQEELAAIEGAQLRSVADEEIGGLTESVGPQLQSLVDSGQIAQEQADEAIGALGQGISEANEDFLSGQIQSIDDLSLQIKSVFAEFVAFLTSAMNPPAEVTEPLDSEPEPTEEVVEQIEPEETIPEEPVTEEPPAEQPQEPEQAGTELAWVEDMTAAFETALTEFTSAISEVKVLPEFSPPKNNGAAYQKFLDIYNELDGLTVPTPPESEVTLDAVT